MLSNRIQINYNKPIKSPCLSTPKAGVSLIKPTTESSQILKTEGSSFGEANTVIHNMELITIRPSRVSRILKSFDHNSNSVQSLGNNK